MGQTGVLGCVSLLVDGRLLVLTSYVVAALGFLHLLQQLHPGLLGSLELIIQLLPLLDLHQLLVIIVLLPVLDGLDHVVHKIVLHSQVQLASPVRLVEDGLPGGLCGPVLWAWKVCVVRRVSLTDRDSPGRL